MKRQILNKIKIKDHIFFNYFIFLSIICHLCIYKYFEFIPSIFYPIYFLFSVIKSLYTFDMYSKFYFSYMKILLYKILMYNSLTNSTFFKGLYTPFRLTVYTVLNLVNIFVVSFDHQSFSQQIGKAQRDNYIVRA